MPTPAYISIHGKNQGHISKGAFTADSVGNVYVEGHEDEILAQAIDHTICTPTDPQSGQPAGQRVHKPLIFTSALNKASPMLYQALATGETLPTVEVKWFRTCGEGKQQHFFTTKLEDATVVEIETVLPHAQDSSNANYTQLIRTSLAYRKISWIHVVAGTEASDDWRKPAAAG
ncbi:type VI secretion system tube protein Hcp [Pseudomonas sp. FDAARGOS_380]|jgi:type VI secretion system secreted protein Hcp|uniref:Hcp family type VI secretion system effector n=1 Tax=Pseudomonas lactis TaxID=1615674 RepID=A0A921NDS7_9PSED|nr:MULTISPECIES: Hcp family type VI secretion system effector [Pseudomonas]ATN13024.1 type VI secretion system tube protein Hcp [Pseudomonas sp. FDAARGOS_380]MQB16430.1 Hcp family type VI secretion system effector [Pseudomonas lactis]NMX29308.1 Hcp family type VI secretion system effector [Pseudomonas sp. WS 5406]HJH17586.1 Hcp family type VI secretion system effector [Pseudomonas lactis]